MVTLRAAVVFTLTAATAGQDLFLSSSLSTQKRPAKPNLVWFLTDDQDQLLGASFPILNGATPMPKTKKLMQDQGAYAENWYIHTPICSPSRSELLTGRYFHNIKEVGGKGYCAGMHVNYTKVIEENFAKVLQDNGYATGIFGKYVNEMESVTSAGWDAWFANGGGNYIAPSFETKNIDGLPDGTVHFTNDPSNYSTAVIGNTSIAWIKKVAKQGKPFFAYIAPKAAHEPFNPAVWYRDHWDASWPKHEPRPENWNCSAESRKDHHGNIATEPMITSEASKVITGVFKNRWRTLMSVDDVIGDVIETVEQLGLSDSTYFFYSSDHGFQLGQYNIPMDKRQVYEWDTKIHLLARGPGIKSGSTFKQPGTQVDIAPTLLGLAGVKKPASMDGHSIVPFILGHKPDILDSTQRHLSDLGDLSHYTAAWRQEVFIEYYFCAYNVKCMSGCKPGKYPEQDSMCVDLANNADCWCGATGDKPTDDPNCYTTEDPTNNFIALREFTGGNTVYAEFETGDLTNSSVNFDKINFREYYNLDEDPWQMKNKATSMSKEVSGKFHSRLHEWLKCAGNSCP
jgi:N-acetylglucosamine-6-sulfatase